MVGRRIIYRDAITGKIVTKQYAKENPDTTVKERMKWVPTEAVEILRKYNEWRRDDSDTPMAQPHPTEIGRAIDEIINYFDR